MPFRLACAVVACLPLVAVAPAAAQYTLYYGNFHAHSTISNDAQGASSGPPSTAFTYARDVAGLDVMSLTDHSHYMSASEYSSLQSDADTYTTNGVFVAIAAQEHGSLSSAVTGAFGHMNIYDAASVLHQGTYRYDLVASYGQTGTSVDETTGGSLVASFNHAYSGAGAGPTAQFSDFLYNAWGDSAVQFIEVINGKRSADYESEYFEALAKGWHVGALGNQDNHQGAWGDQVNNAGNIPLTGIWAPALTRADILDAMRARRTFAMEVDPATDRISLEFTMDGNWMGSEYATEADSVAVQVVVSAETNIASLQLFRNGTFLKSIGVCATSFTWDAFDTPGPGDFYYLVRVNQSDGDHAWSSPIWVESTSSFSLPIATVNQDDANGFPLLWFQNVTVQGLVTVDTDTLDTTDNIIFIQDATGGLMMREFGSQSVHLVPGDNVLITGFVDTFQGQTFLSAPSAIEILSQGGAPPDPVLITTNELETQGETWEGSIVELRDVAITDGTWPVPGFDGSVTIDDGSGPARLFIDKDTVLDDLGVPGEPTFSVRGILIQQDLTVPYDCCYAVMPRFGDDIFQLTSVSVSELPSHHSIVRAALYPSRPNPVRSGATIRFDVSGAKEQSVKLDIFDVNGRRVRMLVNDTLPPGEFEVTWNRRADTGDRVAAGVYFVRLVTPTDEISHKMVVLR